MKNTTMQPAVFLDRDGTLIEEVNYLSRIEDLRVFPFAAEAIGVLKAKGFLVIVVTNQSGIGRGIYDEGAMHSIHEKIQAELNGAIDGFYFCPHLPCDGCSCRKPGLGMIKAAQADFLIDMHGSWMIGDKQIDVETGHAAGLKTAHVMTGYGIRHKENLKRAADISCEHLGAAVASIVSLTIKSAV